MCTPPPTPPSALGEAVGTWPRGSHSTDWPVTYDLGGIENMSSPIWFSLLGIWFTKLQGLNQLGKGQKRQELPGGGREEATAGQNHMPSQAYEEAEAMSKQEADWQQAGEQQSRHQEPWALGERCWRELLTLERFWLFRRAAALSHRVYT